MTGGGYLANRVMRHVRAVWNTALRRARLAREPDDRGALEQGAPATGTDPVGQVARVARGRRQTLPVRRDYQLVVLLTGLRRRDASSIRWEHANLTDKPITSRAWNLSRERWDESSWRRARYAGRTPRGARIARSRSRCRVRASRSWRAGAPRTSTITGGRSRSIALKDRAVRPLRRARSTAARRGRRASHRRAEGTRRGDREPAPAPRHVHERARRGGR